MAKNRKSWSTKKQRSGKRSPAAVVPPSITDLGMYFVAVVDIVGQNKALEKLSAVPQTEAEIELYRKHIENTFGVVRTLRTSVQHFVRNLHRPRNAKRNAPTVREEDMRRLDTFHLAEMSFSDSSFYFGSLGETGEHTPVHGLVRCLDTLAAQMIASLANGRVLRMAVCIGVGAQINKQELYGPAIALAHHLETKCVKWPRILVHESVALYLEDWINKVHPHDALRPFILDWAKDTRARIVRDPADGALILDYLGAWMRRGLQGSPQVLEYLVPWVHQGHAFVRDELRRFQNDGDEKLVNYYGNLCSYYDANLANWSD